MGQKWPHGPDLVQAKLGRPPSDPALGQCAGTRFPHRDATRPAPRVDSSRVGGWVIDGPSCMAGGLPPGPGIAPQALPSWLGPIVAVVTNVGLPTVFAGILLWFVLTRLAVVLDGITRAEAARTAAVASLEEEWTAALEVQTRAIVAALEENRRVAEAVGEELRRGASGPPVGRDGRHHGKE